MDRTRPILVLGATGMLGLPVARCLADRGWRVRALVRSAEKARRLLGEAVEIIEGNGTSPEDVRAALAGCDAAHINLSQESEFAATRHVLACALDGGLERVTYVSATTACQENRWFDLIDVKMRTEAILRSSGVPHTVFCPTWAMETLHNFVRDGRIVAIIGRRPPALHFFAAADFGRMVAVSYEDGRALGKRLFVHGPEALTVAAAIERYARSYQPARQVMRLGLWQAGLIARLTRREQLAYAVRLIAYFDRVGELGDPTEANALLGAPTTTLDDWLKRSKVGGQGPPRCAGSATARPD